MGHEKGGRRSRQAGRLVRPAKKAALLPAPRRPEVGVGPQASSTVEPESEVQLKLPNMNEFSPGVLECNVRELLVLITPWLGDRAGILSALMTRPRIAATKKPVQREVRAGNVLIGMSQCGLFDLRSNQLTEVGDVIRDASSDAEASALFAKHVFFRVHGRMVLEIAGVLRRRHYNASFTNDDFRRELEARGYKLTTNESNFSKLRQWMEHAGIVDSRWMVDDKALRELVGESSETIQKVSGLDPALMVWLRHLYAEAKSLSQDEPIDLARVKELVDLEAKGLYNEAQIRKQVLEKLESLGFIRLRAKPEGRGGKIGLAYPTADLLDLQGEFPLSPDSGIPRELRAKMSIPLADLIRSLDDTSTHVRGEALELLALRILKDIGLVPVGFRQRAASTAYQEADLIADGLHLHYSRWLVQCKNVTGNVGTPHLLREYGLAMLLKAHVILLVSTGGFAEGMESLAAQIAETSHIQVVLISRAELDAFVRSGRAVFVELIKRQSMDVLRLKRAQLDVPSLSLRPPI